VTAEIGRTLREARVRRGLELSDVEQETRIRAGYLRAMEEDEWERLPSGPYRRRFLATYAELLELDPEPLVAEYRRTHEQEQPAQPIPETMLPKRGEVRRSPIGPRAAVLVGLIALAALGAVAVAVVTGGSDDAGERADRGPTAEEDRGSPATTAAEPQTSEPAEVSVELRSVGTVWVCVIDDRGRELVDGETLTADQARGPFEARAFRVSFGNGSIRMTVDDDPVEIPAAAEPLGYRVTPEGVAELEPSARPTCV
jgi:cytoskeleton protein RodZ